MTIQEITALRREGRLEEALAGAKSEFEKSANKFTASALFWCLNDICKKETDLTVVAEIYEQMKSLYENYRQGEDDDIMVKALNYIFRRIDPLGQKINEAIEATRNGKNNNDALAIVQQAFDNGELDERLYSEYGWLIYITLKNTPDSDVRKKKILLHNYLRLGLERPSRLHSAILQEAVNLEKNNPLQFRIRDFMNLWGWENIREDDWIQFQSENGHTVTSLVEKLIAVYAKELKTDKIESPAEFESLVDRGLVCFQNNQYMPLYYALVLLSKGEKSKALDYYKMLLLKSPSKCFLWKQASELVDDDDLRIALLCKAIAVERNENFKGSSRLKLAEVLLAKGYPANAKFELDTYRNYYVSQGWHLKPEFRGIDNRIPSNVVAADNRELYNRFIPLAEEFIYSTLPSVLAVKVADKQVEDKNKPGAKYIQWTLKTNGSTVFLKKPRRFGLDNRIGNGTLFDVRLQDRRIVWIKESKQVDVNEDWIKSFEGVVRIKTDRNGNPYTILNDVFVGRKLLNGITDGQSIKGIALKQDDGRWSAVSIKPAQKR